MFDKIAHALAAYPTAEKRAFNPCPPGSILPGSSTDVALRYFRRMPDRWLLHSEVVLALGRSKGEADWALRRLTELGWLEVARSCQSVYRYKFKNKDKLSVQEGIPTCGADS